MTGTAPTHAAADNGISVVVPSYRRPGELRRCLRSLLDQRRAAHEIIVVLRGDDIEGQIVVDEIGAVARVVTVSDPGQVAALNRGCEAALGELIAITDDDAAPRPDWLAAIAARFASDARIGAVGGRDVVHFANSIMDGSVGRVGRVLWWGRRVGNHHLRSGLQDVDFLKGANMAFRATARQRFDPRLRGDGAQVCNDLEASWSVRRRGWRVVFDPDVVVDHYIAARPGGESRVDRSSSAECDEQHNEVYALLKHAGWWRWPFLLGYALLIGSRKGPGVLLAVRPGISRAERARVVRLAVARLSALRSLAAAKREDQLFSEEP